MTELVLKTPFQVEKEKREMALYVEYNQLISVEGQSKTAVNSLLMSKYGLHSASTLYNILKRVEQRIKGGNQ